METGLRRLRYFQALAEELSFRRASQRLNITQPALSRAIAQLEYEVGARLFERTNRSVALTHAGRTFAAGSARAIGALETAIEETLNVARGNVGTLTIGYTDTVISGVLPDIIRTFREARPGIVIRLRQVYTEQQLAMLEEGSIDIGFLTGPVTRDNLEVMDVQRDRFMAVLPCDHPLAALPELALSDLLGEPFVLGDSDHWSAYLAQLYRYCERAGLRPHIVQTAPEARAIIGLVTCALGVTVMPASLAQNPDARVIARPLSDVTELLLTLAAWPERSTKPALAQFIDHLRKSANCP